MPLLKQARPASVLVLVIALLVSVFGPVAWAESKTTLFKDHTDAFYVLTDSGKPVVKVANGIRVNMYDPASVSLRIDSSTYAEAHQINGLDKGQAGGYFTGSWDADAWFEPGWNAPGFKANGFTSLQLNFSAIEGPGKIALVGNSPADDESGAVGSFLDGGGYYVEKGSVLPIKGHEHAHWFFTHAGTYTMHGSVLGTKEDGTEVRSDPFSLEWVIVKSDADGREAEEPVPELTPESTPEPSPTGTPSEQPSPTGEPSDAPGSVEPRRKLDSTPVDIASGHIDMFTVFAEDGNLFMALKDDRNGEPVYRDPSAVRVKVSEKSLKTVPEKLQPKLVKEGYLLPQSGENQQDEPFPGWDTQEVAPDFSAIDLEFVEVEGPGRVFAFQQSINGLLSPFEGEKDDFSLTTGRVIHQKQPSHVHANWLFEKRGTYTMTVRAKGIPVGEATANRSAANSAEAVSPAVTYTWVVGEESEPSTKTSDAPNPSESEPTNTPPESSSGGTAEDASGESRGESQLGGAVGSEPQSGNNIAGESQQVSANDSGMRQNPAQAGSDVSAAGSSQSGSDAHSGGTLPQTGTDSAFLITVAGFLLVVGASSLWFVLRRS